MKKILLIALSLFLVMSLVACTKDKKETKKEDSYAEQEMEQEELHINKTILGDEYLKFEEDAAAYFATLINYKEATIDLLGSTEDLEAREELYSNAQPYLKRTLDKRSEAEKTYNKFIEYIKALEDELTDEEVDAINDLINFYKYAKKSFYTVNTAGTLDYGDIAECRAYDNLALDTFDYIVKHKTAITDKKLFTDN